MEAKALAQAMRPNGGRPPALARFFLLLWVLLAAYAAFLLLCHFDNKYTWPGPDAERGVLTLTAEEARGLTLIFLDGEWAFYEDRLLSPEDFTVEAPAPDRYLRPGDFGGFELGDPQRDPRGCATYRLLIRVQGPPREWTLELPEIFSAYRLWVNGEERMTLGDPAPGSYRAQTRTASVTFRAHGETELLLAVSNFTNYYSGLVYPPALGRPDIVSRRAALQLGLHVFFGSLAFFVGLFILLTGAGRGRVVAAVSFFAVCLCFAGYTSYPLLHLFALSRRCWYTMEKLSFYGMLFLLCTIAGGLCQVGSVLRAVSFSIGSAVCGLVALFPMLPCAWDVEAMRCYSGLLQFDKWASAAYLIIIGLRAVLRGTRYSLLFLIGSGVFGCSLAADITVPRFEPVYTGWPVEMGGLALLLTIGGILVADTLHSHQEAHAARMREAAARDMLLLHQEHAHMLEEYIRQTGVSRHEWKKNLSLLHFYLDTQNERELRRLLDRLCETKPAAELPTFTQHPLVNCILAAKFGRAQECGVQTECFVSIPAALPMEDMDLCSLLSNLLDNAVEECLRLPPGAPRWIRLQMRMSSGYLLLTVENTARDRSEGGWRTSKENKLEHGYGLEIIQNIIEKHHGIQTVRAAGGVFSIHAALLLEGGPAEDERC